MFYGVGFNDRKFKTKVGGKHIKEYKHWSMMLARCYSENTKEGQLRYIDCSVSDNFKSYSYFYEWCQKQTGFDSGFDLDKDLLVKGNKIYSEDLCLFLPKEVNRALCKNNKSRGKHPIGTNFNKSTGMFDCYVRKTGERIFLGSFGNKLDAFNCYKREKESYMKQLANKYQAEIDHRAYKALMNYQVEITD